jgi:alpha-galactosidase
VWSLCGQGYRLLALDDNWGAENRNASGAIVGDPTRFPSGMAVLSDYVHGRGLLFGLCA